MMKMKELKSYDIKFSGLKNGKHQYQFHLNQNFFNQFDFKEFNDSNLDILVDFNKSDNLLEFDIQSKGTVNIPCDISGENYDQEIDGHLHFLVKFGEAFNDDREDLIIIPYNAFAYNIAQQIYESVVLNVPSKRIHPDILSGKKQTENTKYIINYQNEDNSENKSEQEEIDPRWAALKKILTDKKQ